MAAKARRKISRQKPAKLAPFPEVVDTAHVRGWTVTLDWGREGWVMDVRDQGELLARGVSRLSPPKCFPHLARIVSKALERSGRLS